MFGKKVLDETGDKDVRGPIKQMLSERYAHYKRVGQILSALSKYGFGKMWDSATLLRDLPLESDVRKDLMDLKDSVRFRLLLENLGPTFIKLGQMLSTRPDLIPEEYVEELANLRDDVPPFPFDEVKVIVEEELGAKISETFKEFEEEPIAAASIGQVHRASLRETGEKVAVKIQRPNIMEMIKADIEILKDLAGVLERSFKSIERFDPEGVVKEFGHMIVREIDYTIEARNIQRFKHNMEELETIVIPKVYWKYCTRKVLVMEFVSGVPIDRKKTIKKWKTDQITITNDLGRAYIKQIFVDGFFHADPHQGNLFVLKGNKVCFLDFGAIGYLDDQTRDKVSRFYMSLVQQDVGTAAKALLDICEVSEKDLDVHKLEWDLRDFMDFNFLRKEKVAMSKGMNQKIVTIALKHNIMLPSSFVLLERALMQIEGVCRDINPDFDIVDLAQQNFAMMVRSRYSLKLDPMQHLETAHKYREFMKNLPHRADKVLKKLENDEVKISIDTSFIDDFKHHMRRTALIVAVSLMAAALLIYVAWAGNVTGLGLIPTGISAALIIIVWLATVIIIHRRS
jgi:ubiquinone biosynthesis protein